MASKQARGLDRKPRLTDRTMAGLEALADSADDVLAEAWAAGNSRLHSELESAIRFVNHLAEWRRRRSDRRKRHG